MSAISKDLLTLRWRKFAISGEIKYQSLWIHNRNAHDANILLSAPVCMSLLVIKAIMQYNEQILLTLKKQFLAI